MSSILIKTENGKSEVIEFRGPYSIIEKLKNNKDLTLHKGLTLEEAEEAKDHYDIQKRVTVIMLGNEEYCQTCKNLGYLEVCQDNDQWVIEACETCDYFGIMTFDGQPSLNDKARAKAIKDGLKLNKNGSIKK